MAVQQLYDSLYPQLLGGNFWPNVNLQRLLMYILRPAPGTALLGWIIIYIMLHGIVKDASSGQFVQRIQKSW